MKELDIVYEDTGNHLKENDISYFTTTASYYDKLDLEKYHIKNITRLRQEYVDRKYDVLILRGKVKDILKAYEDIGEYDFYSEEPVAMFFQNPIEGA